MTRIVTEGAVFDQIPTESEADLEAAIIANAGQVFGHDRYYLDCKRRIGAKGKKQNIPDAYLIDLGRKEPRLFVVENELAGHDPFDHIGVQLLGFSHTYHQAGRQLRAVLFEEISKMPDIRDPCETYAKENGYRNLDNLLDFLVFESPFQALVIIDEATEELHSVVKQFSFPVEIIEFVTYSDSDGHKAYRFSPFLQDVAESGSIALGEREDIGALDTIVVPAREEGFQEVFLGENRWYAIRMHSSMIPQIKHIAAYRVAPMSAITHVAPVSKIVSWKDSAKYCVEFAEAAREIEPIKLDSGVRGAAPQGPRYTKECIYGVTEDPLVSVAKTDKYRIFTMYSTSDREEGHKAFVEKRDPSYKGK